MIGKTLSHYKILSKLGEGGMGAVYLAEDTELGRQVALKILPEEMAESPERLERFRREARAVAALDHPNIIRIHNFEEAAGVKLLVMEAVDGQSLDRIIPPGGMPLAKVFSIAVPMASALDAAHQKGITHRDLKPANVMVRQDGSVKVLDFGLAKLATEDAGAPVDEEMELATATAALTAEGVVMGTAPYMSPEQLQGQPVDSRTDIFSLGIVLYEMVTGQRPFQGESGIDLASRILRETPSSATDLRADLPRHFGRIIQHCLEKDPERRFQSAKDVRNELEALEGEIASGPVATGSQPAMPAAAAQIQAPASGVASVAPAAPAPAAPSGPGTAVSDPGSIAAIGAQPVAGGSRLGRWVGIAGALIVVAAGAWWLGRGAPDPAAPDAGGIGASSAAVVADTTPSVAVMPFADLSPDKDQEYFTDGMTEELLSALGKIEGLQVPSRTAIFALKDKGLAIAQVGERLGVATVLEGSVRKAGNRLRISTQLIQVSDGFQLWAETYDRELEDVFAVQDEIATSIATALEVTLTPGALREAELGGTTDTEAYDFYLKGQQYLARDTTEDLEHAVQLYETAVGLDPDYAYAYAALAICHLNLHTVSGADAAQLEAADQASLRALEIAPELAAAHEARAAYLGRIGDLAAAAATFETAIQLDPLRPQTYFEYGALLYRDGELIRTAELWEKAVELDPDFLRPVGLLAQVYASLGREDDAQASRRRSVVAYERYLALNPGDWYARLGTGLDLLALGERERAFEIARPVLDSEIDDSGMLYAAACFYSIADDLPKALDSLEAAVDAGYMNADWIRQDSDLDNIRDHPRFEKLLGRMESGA